MVKVRRPSNFMLTLNTILCIFAIITTIYATTIYFSGLQKGKQEIKYAVTVNMYDFTLPTAYINTNGWDYAKTSENSTTVLSLETFKPGLVLSLHSNNSISLSVHYSFLRLELLKASNDTAVGTLDLLLDTTLSYTLSDIGTYAFRYRISWTAKAPTIAEILILIDVAVGE